MHLYAGDAIETLDSVAVNEKTGKIVDEKMTPGDGTVTRTSAVSEERTVNGIQRNIPWGSKTFLSSDHVGLTKDRAFVDNVLSRLLENPTVSASHIDEPTVIVSAGDFSDDVPSSQPALLDSLPAEPLDLDSPTQEPLSQEAPVQEPAFILPQPESLQKSLSDILIDSE